MQPEAQQPKGEKVDSQDSASFGKIATALASAGAFLAICAFSPKSRVELVHWESDPTPVSSKPDKSSSPAEPQPGATSQPSPLAPLSTPKLRDEFLQLLSEQLRNQDPVGGFTRD